MREPLVNIKPCLHEAIDLMEHFYESANRSGGCRSSSRGTIGPWLEDAVEKLEADLSQLKYSAQKAALVDQTRAIWDLSVCRNIPAIWFIRTRNPVTVLLAAICEMARVPIPRVLNGELGDRDFPRLICTVGRFSCAPLRVCDARDSGTLLNVLPTLFLEDAACFVVCDWHLEGEEWAAALELKDESPITFMCPSRAVC